MDIEENPDNVSFPNGQTCRELSRLKKEVEALQEKCKECHSKNPGGDQSKISSLERNAETLKRGLSATIEVTDPERFPIGKYIVIQESLIYLVEGNGSLILDRPLCRDFLGGNQCSTVE